MNMKRLFGLFLVISILVPLGVLAESVSSLPFYRISESLSSPCYQLIENENGTGGYRWSVVSEHENTLAEGAAGINQDPPYLVYAYNSILCLCEGGGNAFWYTFYDVAQERISPVFQNVIAVQGETVLYTDLVDNAWRLVLASMFDQNILCSQSIDLQSAEGHVERAEWRDGDNAWLVTYLAGNDYSETTILFPDHKTDTLYPIRKNGLWGYMNRQGEVVIEPQFEEAEEFRGRYARVVLPSDDSHGVELEGILNLDGEWALAPGTYYIVSRANWDNWIGGVDTGIYLVYNQTGTYNAAGYFDIPSGFWSDLIYEDVDDQWLGNIDAELVCVTVGDRKGFAERTTGNIVIPCEFDSLYYYSFIGDYCIVRPDDAVIADAFILIDRQGRKIPLPDNCYVTYSADANEGLIPIWNMETDLYGYMDTAGNIVIEPQYQFVYMFSESRACVWLSSGQNAVITPENEIKVYLVDAVNRTGSSYAYSHGLLRLAHYSEDDDLEYIAFIDLQGREAFRITAENLIYADDFYSCGASFYSTGQVDRYGNVTHLGDGLYNAQGEILTPPVFMVSEIDWLKEFSEGLFPITSTETGKKGYIDERGR